MSLSATTKQMKEHNKNIDEICWCEVCESYRNDYYTKSVDNTIAGYVARKINYFIMGLLAVSIVFNVVQHFAIIYC